MGTPSSYELNINLKRAAKLFEQFFYRFALEYSQEPTKSEQAILFIDKYDYYTNLHNSINSMQSLAISDIKKYVTTILEDRSFLLSCHLVDIQKMTNLESFDPTFLMIEDIHRRLTTEHHSASKTNKTRKEVKPSSMAENDPEVNSNFNPHRAFLTQYSLRTNPSKEDKAPKQSSTKHKSRAYYDGVAQAQSMITLLCQQPDIQKALKGAYSRNQVEKRLSKMSSFEEFIAGGLETYDDLVTSMFGQQASVKASR